MTDYRPIGTVYLVGSGPGDPDLITVKGLNVLRCADVVLYDRLIPRALLSETRPDAELIDVGKTSHRPHRLSQEAINDLIVRKASEGNQVVRLKGGDPFVFGRGGEEMLACRAAGVPCVVVPGVTSAIAVPASAGVPVTHRTMASLFTVFAGHEDPSKEDSAIDYEALAKIAGTGTLVLLMGASRLAQIVDRLVAVGLNPETPAICIERGTTEQQRVVEGTIGTLPRLALDANINPPATTVIGPVASLRSMLMAADEIMLTGTGVHQ